MTRARIELLPLGLLKSHPGKVAFVDEIVRELDLTLGWHYLLDLVWALAELEAAELRSGATILDAGAGLGAMQFCLAGLGYEVLSVDFADRQPSPRMLERYRITRAGAAKAFDHPYLGRDRAAALASLPGRLKSRLLELWARVRPRDGATPLVFHQADLTDLSAIASDSVDAVVSVSALEHNGEAQVARILDELRRVLKPGGPMLITTSASGGEDWFHEESHGWCYSEETLRRVFLRGEPCASNYSRYEELMKEIRSSEEMRSRLHPVYYRSGRNGMPWGVWDPRYYPVGVAAWKERR